MFLTTNHPEHLDPALVRSGRVDGSVLLDDATPAQAKKLFLKFYGAGDGDVEGWTSVMGPLV